MAAASPVLRPEAWVDPEKVCGRPAVDVEVGQVGLAVLGGADKVHGCPCFSVSSGLLAPI